jgi:carboxymethylenebutenolidase
MTTAEFTERQLILIQSWEAHMKAEFADSSVEETMNTMIEEIPDEKIAFVNHVPTMTGGFTRNQVKDFYTKYFIPQMPEGTETKLISRTVGNDQIVDEMIFSFNHNIHMAWMLPGINPTFKNVEIPLVAIIGFDEKAKVAFERIYWDQAGVLLQLGLINAKGLPIVGIEQARKVQDPSLPSNELIEKNL